MPGAGMLPRNYLKAWRKRHGLTQQALGELLDLDHSTIGRLEKGISWFKGETIKVLLAHFRIDAADLFGRDPNDEDGVWTYACALKELPAQNRELIYAMIRAALAKNRAAE